MKTRGSTPGLHWKLLIWSAGEVSGIPSVAVKCVDIRGTPVAKAAYWTVTDVEARKRGGANRIRYPGSPRRKR